MKPVSLHSYLLDNAPIENHLSQLAGDIIYLFVVGLELRLLNGSALCHSHIIVEDFMNPFHLAGLTMAEQTEDPTDMCGLFLNTRRALAR